MYYVSVCYDRILRDVMYRPVKFEQTLGKLSQSSLSAPRKMIDAPLSGGVGEGGGGGGGREFTARKRQVLLIIEKVCSEPTVKLVFFCHFGVPL